MSKKNSKKYIMMSSEFRSGSALASCILNAHPDVKFSTDIIKYWLFIYSNEQNLNRSSINKILKEINKRLYSRFAIDFDVNLCIMKINNNYSHANVYKCIYEIILDKNDKAEYIGENETLSWKKIPYFLENIPHAKALMIIRDPRDVLVSFKKHTFVKGNNYLVSVFNSLSLMQSWKKYQIDYKGKFYGFRFEDLKKSHKKYAQEVSSFLKIKYSKDMINPKKWKIRLNDGWKLWENEKSSSFYGKGKKNLELNPINRWKKLIDPVDLFICEWILGDTMNYFGYKPQGKFKKNIFDKAIIKLTSTQLLRDCLYEYLINKNGSENYPVDPKNPKNWDTKALKNYKR
jgi:hypothetical protein